MEKDSFAAISQGHISGSIKGKEGRRLSNRSSDLFQSYFLCALYRKRLLYQGKLEVYTNRLVFSASVLGGITEVYLPSEIDSITKKGINSLVIKLTGSQLLEANLVNFANRKRALKSIRDVLGYFPGDVKPALENQAVANTTTPAIVDAHAPADLINESEIPRADPRAPASGMSSPEPQLPILSRTNVQTESGPGLSNLPNPALQLSEDLLPDSVLQQSAPKNLPVVADGTNDEDDGVVEEEIYEEIVEMESYEQAAGKDGSQSTVVLLNSDEFPASQQRLESYIFEADNRRTRRTSESNGWARQFETEIDLGDGPLPVKIYEIERKSEVDKYLVKMKVNIAAYPNLEILLSDELREIDLNRSKFISYAEINAVEGVLDQPLKEKLSVYLVARSKIRFDELKEMSKRDNEVAQPTTLELDALGPESTLGHSASDKSREVRIMLPDRGNEEIAEEPKPAEARMAPIHRHTRSDSGFKSVSSFDDGDEDDEPGPDEPVLPADQEASTQTASQANEDQIIKLAKQPNLSAAAGGGDHSFYSAHMSDEEHQPPAPVPVVTAETAPLATEATAETAPLLAAEAPSPEPQVPPVEAAGIPKFDLMKIMTSPVTVLVEAVILIVLLFILFIFLLRLSYLLSIEQSLLLSTARKYGRH